LVLTATYISEPAKKCRSMIAAENTSTAYFPISRPSRTHGAPLDATFAINGIQLRQYLRWSAQ
jgi:hypothetical protein